MTLEEYLYPYINKFLLKIPKNITLIQQLTMGASLYQGYFPRYTYGQLVALLPSLGPGGAGGAQCLCKPRLGNEIYRFARC